MRAGAFKANVGILFCEGINQNPVRLDVAIVAAGKIPTQRMVSIFRRQGFSLDQQVHDCPKFREVFAAFIRELHVLLELAGTAECPHMPRSA